MSLGKLKPNNLTSDDILKYDIKILVIKDNNLSNLKNIYQKISIILNQNILVF